MNGVTSRSALKLVAALSLLGCLLFAGGAEAAFPGDNGSILYGRKAFHKPQAIYSIDPKGGKSTLLTEDEGSSGAPSVSADGTEFVFIGSVRPREGGIFTMPVDGGKATQVPLPDGLRFASPSFSPDGKQIVFSGVADNSTDDGDIWLMNRDGSDAHAIVTAKGEQATPKFSPDGSRILFTSTTPRTNQSDVEDVKPDGSDVRDLTARYSNRSDFLDADYSPDGKRIVLVDDVFTADGGETSETADLATMKPDGSGLKVIKRTKQLETEPVFSPDGKSIAFVRYVSGTEMKVLTMKTNGRGIKEVVSMENDISSGTPTWQPLP